MVLDFDTCYRAVLARDPRFDGRFFTGVTSTGIYCRPVCPARTPARGNVRFFPHAGAAEAAGFRACRRCRPEASPGSPDWNVRADLAARALRLIADGYVDEHGVEGLARRLAVTDRHLRRLLLAELGATPLALARTSRLQTARRLLDETTMPITDIAFASGFASLRQFNASFREAYGKPPSALRTAAPIAAGRASPASAAAPSGAPDRPGPGPALGPASPTSQGSALGTWVALRLAVRAPFDARALLAFLAARAIPGVEHVSGQRYRRTVRTPGGPAVIELTAPSGQAGNEPNHVLLRARLAGLRGVGQVVSRCRQLLDLDADPAAIGAALSGDEALAPLVAARPGLRVPGAYDGFELAVRAVLGQQVSVAAARTLAGRIAIRFGARLDPGATDAAAADPLSADPLSAEPLSAEPLSAEPLSADPLSAEPTRQPALRGRAQHGSSVPGSGAPGSGTPGAGASGAGAPGAGWLASATAGGHAAGSANGGSAGLADVPCWLFPRPDDLAEADLSGIGLTTARQTTLRALAAAAASGRISLDAGADPEETAARLGEVPGIGPWTVAYVLMRAVRDPDAFPATDLVVRRAMERLGCPPDRAGRWRPWRAYAAMHLWAASPDGPHPPAGGPG